MNNQQKKEKSILGIVWDWIDNSRWNWANAINFRFFEYNDNIDRCAFFEELNCGWYQMYIYPYDDWYHPTISAERKLFLSGNK